MKWRERDKLIESMFNNSPLFIKDTGVQVSVDYFSTDQDRDNNWGRRKAIKDEPRCKVNFETSPTMKALKLCCKFHIKRNSHSKVMEIDAEIKLDKLSTTPFESNAAKVLYEKEKKSK